MYGRIGGAAAPPAGVLAMTGFSVLFWVVGAVALIGAGGLLLSLRRKRS